MEKTMKNKNPLNLYIFVFFILLFLPSNLFSQQINNDQNDVAEFMAANLKQKVLLTDEQSAKVKVILSNYIDRLSNKKNSSENLDKAKNDIKSLLNDKQKAKYDIIKDDFFEEVNKRASSKS
jgi:hypothetical protein